MGETHTGTCFCGAVSIKVTGAPLEMGYCHCNSCRSYSGGAMAAFTLWKTESVEVTRGAELIGRFAKTDMSHRQFCKKCGSRVMTEHPAMGCTDIHAAMFPTQAFKPVVHLNYSQALQPIKDGLPKLKDFPAHAGGSGEVIAE